MLTQCPKWLENSIFYQVYPQSFFDTNSDGVGDLEGIIQKLDYIKSLGCDAIWINPCFESPFGDAGYDVADFYKIASRYGTKDTMKKLFEEAHKKEMKVCLDLVAGHTSDEHPWFKESSKPEKNKYSNWYIWTNSCWESAGDDLKTINGYSDRDGNYVSNFFYFQPALNYGFANPDKDKPWQLPVDHPDVKALRDEIINIMKHWLDLGADGFRVDMASSLVKRDSNKKETSAFWKEVRDIFDHEYPEAVLISEWSNPIQSISAGFHIDFLIHFNNMAYTSLFRMEKGSDINPFRDGHSFFNSDGKGNILEFVGEYMHHYSKTKEKGYITLKTGNHDLPRLSLGRSFEEMETAFTFILTMPGVPFIYYGDEIGMKHNSGLVSKEGGYNRTGARTPMQWSRDKNAGFSTADEAMLYLPTDQDPEFPNVEDQEQDENSLLHKVRKLINLRKKYKALGNLGGYKTLYAEENKYPFVYLRMYEDEKFIVAINPCGHKVEVCIDYACDFELYQLEMSRGITLEKYEEKLKLSMEGISYGVIKLN
jgi:glycosidase